MTGTPGARQALAAALHRKGFLVLGHCRTEADEQVDSGSTLMLIGNAGAAMWLAFQSGRRDEPEPLDRWTRRTIDPIASTHGAVAIYPFDRPHRPFQRWALRAGAAHRSPLGLLIHPKYGLWHAYRAALVLSDRDRSRQPSQPASPCESCCEKPCLTACPVGAFSDRGYDVPACSDYLHGAEGDRCVNSGCAARNACPVGVAYRYPAAQLSFHMTAFRSAVGKRGR